MLIAASIVSLLAPLAPVGWVAPLAQATEISTEVAAEQATSAQVVEPAESIEARFPASTALAEGVSPEALERLGQLVQGFVTNGEIVGAELLVIKNGRSIWHQAYGWNDREAKLSMETGSVFCVRSMTKPVIGAAILMLIEDKQLELGQRVSEYLPAFDVDGTRDITVEQLLTHTSGLPMSLIVGKDLNQLDGIQAVAALGGRHTLEFEPGSAFTYSDQGTDTLTALIEVVSGQPVAEFVRARVLDPLDMQQSACVMNAGNPLRERACSLYVGSPGAWSRYWTPEDAPLFPFFLGSQGLYSTLEDYAGFMDLWLHKGRVGKERLLRSSSVRHALKPGPYPLGIPTGLPGLTSDYGSLMQVWTGPGDGAGEGEAGAERELVAFGHGGSDGTHAWVFPEQNAMVLYFTQSRGSTTGLQVEEALGDLLLGVPFDANQAAPPFEQYFGYYWEGQGDLYRAIVQDGEDLALEILGKGVVPLTYVGEDRWKFRENPSVVLAFDRSGNGSVSGYHIGDHQEFRFEPAAELPSADELAKRVSAAHGIALLETLGPLRTVGKVEIPKLGINGDITTLLAWPDRFRYETRARDQFEIAAFDGAEVWYQSSTEAAAVLSGRRAELMRRDNPLVHLGDWRTGYSSLQVIQQLERDGQVIFVVRAGDPAAPATTLYVDATSAKLLRADGLAYVETQGFIGQRQTFEDYRDVSGMLLPFRTELEFANPLIGTIVTTIDSYELGGEVPAGSFVLGD